MNKSALTCRKQVIPILLLDKSKMVASNLLSLTVLANAALLALLSSAKTNPGMPTKVNPKV
jgi:hypothetical protein